MAFNDRELTDNAFLGGRLRVWQPQRGYRAGIDPVLLAASLEARAGQTVLELGCGAGVASLCLGARVAGLVLTGVELQSDYADLARRNAAENGIEMSVFTADLRALPDDLRAQSFDHVMANPPYFRRAQGTRADDFGREQALAGETPLAAWVEIAARRLKPRGTLTIIQKANRLHDLLRALDDRFGTVSVRPLAARNGRDAELAIVSARKAGRGTFRLLAPIVLHRGARHERDGDSYRAEIQAVLRDGAPLNSAH